ncbi:hypothetical protein PUNSTDRAFT_106990 [Punctularia strigosozonata HHB-11173 SS5]|uniref:uncharacterized protein n=1 Tax=Punctularia strigosozonata (strain HHB-11173) TaxID=741275 RepID=UPI00044162F7|nr:uncharacterized protein PUNSTDRAFT_106990 [Punctularia strigosozonata HHB-11173 SS5]EIN05339.1 hypothetical protein PUNSTDRAFT_106990 [Punctularia strigosozonata HHB-11173 SS5]
MSLPPATKEISDHPAKNTVTEPVNRRQKEEDVKRKLKLYGVVQALRDGRMPSNTQIDAALKHLLASEPVDVDALSVDGKKLIADARDIIETARLLVSDKNADELLQNFIWHTRDVDYDRVKKDPTENVDKDALQEKNKQAPQHLRTLLSLVLTNSEARKLLSDFALIGRDLLAKGAIKAAEQIRPDEERLRRVDEPAPENEFVSKDGERLGPHDGTPVPQVRVPGTGVTVEQHPKEKLGDGATIKTGDGDAVSGAEAKGKVRQKAGETKEEARANADEVAQTTNGVPQTEDEAEAGKKTLKSRLFGFKDAVSSKVPDEHKEKVREHRDRAREFFTEEYFPEERRDQFIFRLKKVVIECQKHKDYQESIRWLIGYVEDYANHGIGVAKTGKESTGQLKEDGSLQQATTELRTLLERFANNQKMTPIFDAVNALVQDSKNDEELKGWFKRVDAYLRKVLLEAGYVIQQESTDDANALKEDGRRFYDDKYKQHFDHLFRNIGDFFKAMGDDPLNKRFGQDWASLTKDLLFDSDGSLKFKPHLWRDIRTVIAPALVDQVGYIPIPRVEYTDAQFDMIIENLTLSGRNLLPNIIAIETDNFLKFSPYEKIKDEHHHELTITLAQIQADMRDVAFWFRKKSGFPKLQDSGLADVLLGGEGLTVTVHLVSADKDPSSVFKVKNVAVKVDTLKFSIRDSKHDLLYKTLRPLATGLVKKQIQKAIADAITTGLEYVDGQLVGVRDRMSEAKASDGTSRREVLKQMFQDKKQTAKAEAHKEKGSKFQVVSKRDSVLLPNQGSPAGWINRVQEREEAASSGKDWRSDAFDVL